MNRVQKPVEETDELCPDCGRNLVIRTGRFGRFISCSGFPECRYRRSFVNKTGALCPQCLGDLVERKTKQKKRVFYGCSNYPTCNFAIWERPVPDLCPNCGGLMVVPRVGQDPVCYSEVAAVQRNTAEKPKQGEKTIQREGRKRAPASETEIASASAETKIRRRATITTATAKKSATTSRRASATTTPTRTRKTAAKTSTRATKTKKPAAQASTKKNTAS